MAVTGFTLGLDHLFDVKQVIALDNDAKRETVEGFQIFRRNESVHIRCAVQRQHILASLVWSHQNAYAVIRVLQPAGPPVMQVVPFKGTATVAALTISPECDWLCLVSTDHVVTLIPIAFLNPRADEGEGSKGGTGLPFVTSVSHVGRKAEPIVLDCARRMILGDMDPAVAVEWWKSFSGKEHVIIGTKRGDLVFVDIRKKQKVCTVSLDVSHLRRVHLVCDNLQNFKYLLCTSDDIKGGSGTEQCTRLLLEWGQLALPEARDEAGFQPVVLQPFGEKALQPQIIDCVHHTPSANLVGVLFPAHNKYELYDTQLSKHPVFEFAIPPGTVRVALGENILWALAVSGRRSSAQPRGSRGDYICRERVLHALARNVVRSERPANAMCILGTVPLPPGPLNLMGIFGEPSLPSVLPTFISRTPTLTYVPASSQAVDSATGIDGYTPEARLRAEAEAALEVGGLKSAFSRNEEGTHRMHPSRHSRSSSSTFASANAALRSTNTSGFAVPDLDTLSGRPMRNASSGSAPHAYSRFHGGMHGHVHSQLLQDGFGGGNALDEPSSSPHAPSDSDLPFVASAAESSDVPTDWLGGVVVWGLDGIWEARCVDQRALLSLSRNEDSSARETALQLRHSDADDAESVTGVSVASGGAPSLISVATAGAASVMSGTDSVAASVHQNSLKHLGDIFAVRTGGVGGVWGYTCRRLAMEGKVVEAEQLAATCGIDGSAAIWAVAQACFQQGYVERGKALFLESSAAPLQLAAAFVAAGLADEALEPLTSALSSPKWPRAKRAHFALTLLRLYVYLVLTLRARQAAVSKGPSVNPGHSVSVESLGRNAGNGGSSGVGVAGASNGVAAGATLAPPPNVGIYGTSRSEKRKWRDVDRLLANLRGLLCKEASLVVADSGEIPQSLGLLVQAGLVDEATIAGVHHHTLVRVLEKLGCVGFRLSMDTVRVLYANPSLVDSLFLQPHKIPPVMATLDADLVARGVLSRPQQYYEQNPAGLKATRAMLAPLLPCVSPELLIELCDRLAKSLPAVTGTSHVDSDSLIEDDVISISEAGDLLHAIETGGGVAALHDDRPSSPASSGTSAIDGGNEGNEERVRKARQRAKVEAAIAIAELCLLLLLEARRRLPEMGDRRLEGWASQEVLDDVVRKACTVCRPEPLLRLCARTTDLAAMASIYEETNDWPRALHCRLRREVQQAEEHTPSVNTMHRAVSVVAEFFAGTRRPSDPGTIRACLALILVFWKVHSLNVPLLEPVFLKHLPLVSTPLVSLWRCGLRYARNRDTPAAQPSPASTQGNLSPSLPVLSIGSPMRPSGLDPADRRGMKPDAQRSTGGYDTPEFGPDSAAHVPPNTLNLGGVVKASTRRGHNKASDENVVRGMANGRIKHTRRTRAATEASRGPDAPTGPSIAEEGGVVVGQLGTAFLMRLLRAKLGDVRDKWQKKSGGLSTVDATEDAAAVASAVAATRNKKKYIDVSNLTLVETGYSEKLSLSSLLASSTKARREGAAVEDLKVAFFSCGHAFDSRTLHDAADHLEEWLRSRPLCSLPVTSLVLGAEYRKCFSAAGTSRVLGVGCPRCVYDSLARRGIDRPWHAGSL
eukprot:Rmarinus@m.19001